MAISRRKFLQLSSLASASLMVPKFLKGFEYQNIANKTGKILIVIQLSGGNDGLNTIIPYRNDIYYSSRPHLAVKQDEVLALTDEIGLNSYLAGIKSLYDEGHVSIVNGVGYPQPDRSHFRSMDIWQTGSTSNELITTGWLGRYMDNIPAGNNCHNAFALEVDDTLNLAMKGNNNKAIAAHDINQFHMAAINPYFTSLNDHAHEHQEALAGYLYKTLAETTSAADYIYGQSRIYNATQTYPDTQIGKRLKTIGSLIASDSETRVYYVSHGSFDTHVNQKEQQNKLFKQLDEAVTSLVIDLKQNNRFDEVMIMTFSEFGRRVAQNASNGTDHGTANSMFFISGGLKQAGMYNPLPDLTDLDEGNVKYSTDFKQVYATVLDKWMNTDPVAILNKKYQQLGFI